MANFFVENPVLIWIIILMVCAGYTILEKCYVVLIEINKKTFDPDTQFVNKSVFLTFFTLLGLYLISIGLYLLTAFGLLKFGYGLMDFINKGVNFSGFEMTAMYSLVYVVFILIRGLGIKILH